MVGWRSGVGGVARERGRCYLSPSPPGQPPEPENSSPSPPYVSRVRGRAGRISPPILVATRLEPFRLSADKLTGDAVELLSGARGS